MPVLAAPFRHEALLYDGDDGFLASTGEFVRTGVARGEPVLVMVSGAKIERLRAELGPVADAVHFEDMDVVGCNPSRLIPAWRSFVAGHRVPGRWMRGIGEPIDGRRSPAALAECQLHESLLNTAFAGVDDFWLRCPYDRAALGADVLGEAHRSHPAVADGRAAGAPAYERPAPEPPAGELPEPDADPEVFVIRDGQTRALREHVLRHAFRAGLSRERVADAVLAVSELAANSVEHGGGHGILRAWEEAHGAVYEVRDRGRIRNAMVGREEPALDTSGGRGLWLVNQLCDLVQIRSSDAGTAVRVHLNRG